MDYLSPIEALFPGVGARVLAVLAGTSEPLTIRQLAERAGAAHPQVSHHVSRLEALGVVERRVAGRSHLVKLTASAAGDVICRLAGLGDLVLDRMRATPPPVDPAPESIVVFGSFARGTARAGSDLDIAIVAPPGSTDDEAWLSALHAWLDSVAEISGNPVAEIIVTADELNERGGEPLWEEIRREGVVVSGASIDDLLAATHQGTGSGRA